MGKKNQQGVVTFDINAAAKDAIAGMSSEEAFNYAQKLADLNRPPTPQEELEFLKIWFGPDAEFSD
jgi:hypothetical protein